MKVIIIHPSAPQLNELTRQLIKRNLLQKCVHSYVTSDDSLERLLVKLPKVGASILKELSRRRLFSADDLKHFLLPVKKHEFAIASQSRLRNTFVSKLRLGEKLIFSRNRALSRSGAKQITNDTDVVIAAYGTGLEAFEAANKYGALKILDYPIAHYRHAEKILQREAELQPKFQATLQLKNESPRMARRYDREFELADYILVASKFVRDSFVSEGIPKSKLITVPYGVQTDHFYPSKGERPKKFNVLFVGAIGQRKGLSYILDAYKKFQKDDTNLTLVGRIIGDGAILDEYAGSFTHIAHVPKSEIADVFRSGSVFLFPTRVEGLPLVVIEAMASGLPVISTDRGPAEIVRDGKDGYVVDANSVDQIVDKLQLLYDDVNLWEQMSHNARTRATEFTWDAYTSQVITALKDVVEKRFASGEVSQMTAK
jgi:starch synthase